MMQTTSVVPIEIRTARVLLRPWRAEDAEDLLPVLEANRDHLGPWIPARVATPAPVPILAERLAGFAADFSADREWRFGMFSVQDGRLLGEVALFPRDAAGRVPFAEADRVELGYWLRADETGRGLVTEAARAVLTLASHIPRFSRAEIRCDARNGPSAAVPPRLGFTLHATVPEAENRVMQVWVSELSEHLRARVAPRFSTTLTPHRARSNESDGFS
jgi:ribosomal-protein-serine acetyltransferase